MENNTIKDHYVVTKDNHLVEARYKKPLTAKEQKIILTMVSLIEPKDKDFKDYTFSVKDFNAMIGVTGGGTYGQIKKVVEELMSKVVEIPSKNGDWVLTHWVSRAKYIEGSGTIQLRFAPELKPYLLQLKAFTSYKLNNILSLKSAYAIRLYELMKKWQPVGHWTCSIEKLRELFGIEGNKYPRYANFNAKVLSVAIKEVNLKTDLHIEIEEIKRIRTIEGIKFFIRHSPDKEITIPKLDGSKNEPEEPKPTEQELRLARFNDLADDYVFDITFFTQLYEGASLIWGDNAEQELEWLVKYVNSSTTVKNPHGFIQFKLTSAWKIHEAGGYSTFANLKDAETRPRIREEKLPEWFTANAEPEVYEDKAYPELDAEKENVLKSLAEKKKNARKKNE